MVKSYASLDNIHYFVSNSTFYNRTHEFALQMDDARE